MAPSELPELSHTAFLKCCKVCEEPEEVEKRFLICGHPVCMYKYYHIRCLTPEQMASEVQLGKPCWYCPSCLCRVCLMDADDDQIVLCDTCDGGYHLYCLSPPRTKVPKGKWVCEFCKESKEKEKRLFMHHRKDHDDAVLKSDKYRGLDLLHKAANMLMKDDEKKVGTTKKRRHGD